MRKRIFSEWFAGPRSKGLWSQSLGEFHLAPKTSAAVFRRGPYDVALNMFLSSESASGEIRAADKPESQLCRKGHHAHPTACDRSRARSVQRSACATSRWCSANNASSNRFDTPSLSKMLVR